MPILVLPVEASVPPGRGGAAVQEVPASRDRGILSVQMPHFVVGAMFVTLVSVGEVAAGVLLVVRWDIGLINAHKVSKDPSHLFYHHQLLFSRS